MKLILSPYQDPSCGLDWHEQTPEIKARIGVILENFDESTDYTIQEEVFGAGADWPTIVINVATVAGLGLIALPEAHKRVREALEEWKIIGNNFRKLINYIAGKESVVSKPIEILFITASESLLSVLKKDDAIFLKYHEILPIGSYDEISGLYDFRFESEGEEWKVLINGQQTVIGIEKV